MHNRFTFHKNTFAVFIKTNEPEGFGKAHYISKHGSQYFFTNDGVYRYSNHWGRVGNCRWRLENIDYKQQTNYWGFCKWIHFYTNEEGLPLFFIEKTDNDHYSYNHKNNAENEQAVFRTASETARVLKKITEIQQTADWAKHLEYNDYEALKDFFIQQLIHSTKSFIKIKQEYISDSKL